MSMNPSRISRPKDVSSRLAQSLLAGLILAIERLPAIGFEAESGTSKAPGRAEVAPVAALENLRRHGVFENSLGMRFVPVKVGSETVDFSICSRRPCHHGTGGHLSRIGFRGLRPRGQRLGVV